MGINFPIAPQSFKPKLVEPIVETWRWQNFPELNGLGCQCMTEDKTGVLWFGILGGVMRYDGLNWKFIPLIKDKPRVPIITLYSSSDSLIYAGSSEGIFVFRDNSWEKLTIDLDFGDPNDFPYNRFPIFETSDGSIWIGARQGALRIKNGDLSLFREEISYNNLQREDSKPKFKQIKSLIPFDIYSISEDEAGSIWFGLRDGRLYKSRVNEDKSGEPIISWKRVDKENGYDKARYPLIEISSSGKIFIISGYYDGGINVFENNSWKHTGVKEIFDTEEIQSDIIELKDGSICFSGIGRLFIIKNNVWNIYERPEVPLPINRLRLFQTSNEKLWLIGISNDVWRIDLSHNKWTTFQDLLFQDEGKDGKLWFISIDNTVVSCDTEMNEWIEYNETDGLIDSPVAVFITRKGEVWVVGSDKHIASTAYFDGRNWIKQHHPKLSWGIDSRGILEANDGSLWFGTCSDFEEDKGQRGGLVKYTRIRTSRGEEFQYEYFPSSEKFELFGTYGIGQTADENIWVGQLGFYKYNLSSRQWTEITEPLGIGQNFIDCIQSNADGNLWVGTRTNGLFFLDNKTSEWTHYTTQNGLKSNSLLDILARKASDVWIATDRDISHFDGRTWTNDIFPGFIKFRREGISLKSTEDGSLWITQNPEIWNKRAFPQNQYSKKKIKGELHTIRYHPEKLTPETEITFSMDKVAQPGNAILSWKASDPWKFTPSNLIEYSYRFDEREWSAYSKETSKMFLSLPSGNHVFEVKSRNRDLNVDPSPAKVTFYVIPPLWEQPWFILLILTFLVTIASFIFYLYRRNRIIRELSEARARLFTNISHELRTPLTLIMGPLSKILKGVEIKEELKQPLSLMERNCQRLLRLINQILDYRRLEVGQMKFEPSNGDIIDFIREEFLSFANLAKSKNIDFRFKTSTDKLEMWFDPDKIEKILFNLLSNAIKFTPINKSVTVEIRDNSYRREKVISIDQSRSCKAINWLEILVIDTGRGISEQNINRVFDSFYQVQDHLNKSEGGTGIGLSITKDMVKIHLGEIFVESSLGVGTTFTVRIPIMNKEMVDGILYVESVDKSEFINHVLVKKDDSELLDSKRTLKKDKDKILIIEDNLDMRQYIKGELICNYDVEEALDGEEGFEKAINYGPDLIISDIMMPNMDGIDLCKKIKTDERTSHISVILLTAKSSKESLVEGLEYGADDYITKPFNQDELLLRIHNMMETRKKIREKFIGSLKLEPKNIEITSLDKKLIQKAIDIIEEHMDDEDFSVEIFSDLMAMHRVSLYNKIKSLTNLTTREFITVIRLKRAAQLLRESGLSITEIAYEVGFKDPSHFTKLFKKQFYKSPREYIKEMKN